MWRSTGLIVGLRSTSSKRMFYTRTRALCNKNLIMIEAQGVTTRSSKQGRGELREIEPNEGRECRYFFDGSFHSTSTIDYDSCELGAMKGKLEIK